MQNATLAAVFAAGLLEGIGVPWPGMFIIAGAAAGLGNGWTDMPRVTAAFAVGYSLGALIQYLLGRLAGPTVLAWLPAAQRAKLQALSAKHGTAMVLWTRPLAVGNYVSIPAGILRMPVHRFIVYTFLGIAPWAASMAAGGWLLGGRVDALSAAIARWFIPGIVGFGVAALLLRTAPAVVRRYRESHREVAA